MSPGAAPISKVQNQNACQRRARSGSAHRDGPWANRNGLRPASLSVESEICGVPRAGKGPGDGTTGTGAGMPQAELQTGRIDCQEEDARLSALASTGILDSEPEPSFDAIRSEEHT